MAVYTYNPSEVILSICGYRITGWVDITVEFDSKPFKKVNGIRGTHARVYSKSTAAAITISVLQTGLANHVLSEIHRQDAQKGTARLEISLQDLSGETRFFSDMAYIDGYPSISFTAEAGTRTWRIECLNTRDVHVGASFKPSVDIFN